MPDVSELSLSDRFRKSAQADIEVSSKLLGALLFDRDSFRVSDLLLPCCFMSVALSYYMSSCFFFL